MATPTNIDEIAFAATAYLTHNRAIRALEIRGTSVTDRTLTAPPVSPGALDVYIPASVATGDWVGQENNLARFENGTWAFYTPYEGQIIYSDGDSDFIRFTSGNWNIFSFTAGASSVAVSANDTTPDFLFNKLVAGANITLTENNDGANETITIASTGGSGGGFTVNSETLAATKTLASGNDTVQALNPNGSARDVVLPDPATNNDHFVIINNSNGLSASGNTLNIKETAAGAFIQTLDDTTGLLSINCIYHSGSSTWILWS